MSSNIVWHTSSVSKKEHQNRNGHRSFVLWFTGLSGSGKSTIANALTRRLFDEGKAVYVLDGDNIRHGLNKDLGFGAHDRKENIRRIGETAKLFIEAGIIISAAFISPYKEDRESVRELVGEHEFIEIYVKCSLSTCEKRDPKGLYKKARSGEIESFTGVSAPYEAPERPEVVIESGMQTVEESVHQIIVELEKRNLI